jgi:hypothetical protein
VKDDRLYYKDESITRGSWNMSKLNVKQINGNTVVIECDNCTKNKARQTETFRFESSEDLKSFLKLFSDRDFKSFMSVRD